MFFFQRKKTDVLFVCTSSVDEIWIRSTAIECAQRGLSVIIASCDSDHDRNETLLKNYADTQIKVITGISLSKAAGIPAKAVVTASSGLTKDIFPTKSSIYVHMPHSLASLHAVYPQNAFDGYDYLFAAGPHHQIEFKAIANARGLTKRKAFPIGYGKLDVLRSYEHCSTDIDHILIASSWGDDNLLDRCGLELVEALVSAGKKVTVRPHPLFMLENPPIMDQLRKLSHKHTHVFLEDSLKNDSAILSAGTMIGDYSGTSLEFVALRHRPIVSVDVGRKIANLDWEALGLPPAEIALRPRLGPVVPPDTKAILTAINSDVRNLTSTIISDFVFDGPETCAQKATNKLMELL